MSRSYLLGGSLGLDDFLHRSRLSYNHLGEFWVNLVLFGISAHGCGNFNALGGVASSLELGLTVGWNFLGCCLVLFLLLRSLLLGHLLYKATTQSSLEIYFSRV